MTAEAPIVKKIVLFKEKHDTTCFDASTPELLGKALLAMLRIRMDSGYWYQEPVMTDTSRYDEYLDIPEETVELLPAAVQEDIKRASQSRRYAEAQYEEELEWYTEAKRILALPAEEALTAVHVKPWLNPRTNKMVESKENLLLWLFRQRANYEYEGWEIETLEIA